MLTGKRIMQEKYSTLTVLKGKGGKYLIVIIDF